MNEVIKLITLKEKTGYVIAGSGKQLFSKVKYKSKYINDIDVKQVVNFGKNILLDKIKKLILKVKKNNTIAFVDLKAGIDKRYRSTIKKLENKKLENITINELINLYKLKKRAYYHYDEYDILHNKSKILRNINKNDLVKIDMIFYNKKEGRYMEISNIYVLGHIKYNITKELQREIITSLILKDYYKATKRLKSYYTYKENDKMSKKITKFLNGKAGYLNFTVNNYKTLTLSKQLKLKQFYKINLKQNEIEKYEKVINNLSYDFLNSII